MECGGSTPLSTGRLDGPPPPVLGLWPQTPPTSAARFPARSAPIDQAIKGRIRRMSVETVALIELPRGIQHGSSPHPATNIRRKRPQIRQLLGPVVYDLEIVLGKSPAINVECINQTRPRRIGVRRLFGRRQTDPSAHLGQIIADLRTAD